jgi:triosephosphate isomerase
MNATSYVIGNWKLNPSTLQTATTLANELNTALAGSLPNCVVGICPSFVHLSGVAEKSDKAVIGVQDICAHTASTGAFTGDVSAEQAVDLGAKFALVGHSERRSYYQESDDTLSAKISNAFNVGLSVVYCIGETQDQYKAGQTFAVLERQLELLQNFAKDIDFTKTSLPKLLIAYEPVWAIGTGLTPTPSEVDSVHNFISEILSTLQIPAPILYGGSVNDKNAQEFASLPMVNGVLVGGASLKADSFMTIIGAFANK